MKSEEKGEINIKKNEERPGSNGWTKGERAPTKRKRGCKCTHKTNALALSTFGFSFFADSLRPRMNEQTERTNW